VIVRLTRPAARPILQSARLQPSGNNASAGLPGRCHGPTTACGGGCSVAHARLNPRDIGIPRPCWGAIGARQSKMTVPIDVDDGAMWLCRVLENIAAQARGYRADHVDPAGSANAEAPALSVTAVERTRASAVGRAGCDPLRTATVRRSIRDDLSFSLRVWTAIGVDSAQRGGKKPMPVLTLWGPGPKKMHRNTPPRQSAFPPPWGMQGLSPPD
jgi:hypothetical protein